MISVPVMSRGHQVGRELDAVEAQVDSVWPASATSSVLARPGTPISRAWPRAKMAISSCSMTLLLADDHLAEFLAEALVGFAEFVDGGDVIGRELQEGRVLDGRFHVGGRVRNLRETRWINGFVESVGR